MIHQLSVPDPNVVPAEVVEVYNALINSPKFRKTIRFQLLPVLQRFYDNIQSQRARARDHPNGRLPTDRVKLMLGGGKCQSRKTPLKLAAIVMSRRMGVPSVLLTTTVPGRDDLLVKMRAIVADLSQHLQPNFINSADAGKRTVITRDGVCNELLAGRGCIVANNTGAALDKARAFISQARGTNPQLQFNLVVDEADDFYRSDGDIAGSRETLIQLQRAFNNLTGIGPLVKFEVSATLLAIFLRLWRMGHATTIPYDDIFYIEASDEYVGTDLLMPFVDPTTGERTFLMNGDLNKRNTWIDDKVRAIYADAAAQPRSLLLDVTTSAVTAPGNTTQKANEVLAAHPHAVAIVVTGSEIKWKRGGERNWTSFFGRDRIFTRILESIDRLCPQQPVFVFGYSQMQRGISYRSSRRVPTHLVLLLGKDMSVCALTQAAGRSLGESRSVLTQNGFEGVTILTLADDYDILRAYPRFLEALKMQMERFNAPLDSALGNFTYSAALNPLTPRRPVGPKKAHMGTPSDPESIVSQIQFDEPQPGDREGAEWLFQQLRTGNTISRALLEVALDCAAEDEDSALSVRTFCELLDSGDYRQFSSGENTPSGFPASTVADRHLQSKLNSLCETRAIRGVLFERISKRDEHGLSARRVAHYYLNREAYNALAQRGYNPLRLAVGAAGPSNAVANGAIVPAAVDLVVAGPPNGAANPVRIGDLMEQAELNAAQRATVQ